jgi:phosphomannomutase
MDGLTINYIGWGYNLHRSPTEPVTRLIFETREKDWLEEKKNEVLVVIRKADPGMERRE